MIHEGINIVQDKHVHLGAFPAYLVLWTHDLCNGLHTNRMERTGLYISKQETVSILDIELLSSDIYSILSTLCLHFGR